MTIPSDLLADIIADPDNDTLRMIAADWLEDHGDARGEIIRWQVKENYQYLTESGRAAEYTIQRPECGVELVILEPARGMVRYTVSRGFVEGLICSWEDWCQHADAILKRQPIRKVSLTMDPDNAMRTFSWKLGGIAVVEVAGQRVEVPCFGTKDNTTLSIDDCLKARWPGIIFEFPGYGYSLLRGLCRRRLTAEEADRGIIHLTGPEG